jgi:hypothetical protein
MSQTELENLINLIAKQISRKDTKFGKAIPVQERLALTLRFCHVVDFYVNLQYVENFRP